eukprot:1091488-Prymnesium_polylepis.1
MACRAIVLALLPLVGGLKVPASLDRRSVLARAASAAVAVPFAANAAVKPCEPARVHHSPFFPSDTHRV